MATSNSMASISRRLITQLLLPNKHKPISSFHDINMPKSSFSTGADYTSDLDEMPIIGSDSEQPIIDDSPELGTESSPSSSFGGQKENSMPNFSLKGGLDIGIYKALLVGQVGQSPFQKRLKNGRMVTLTTVGTGGIRNERIPFPTEEPREYADRCNVQWHRVSIYPERLGDIVMKHAQPGVLLYLEGNLETKIFTDQVTGLVRRVREIAVRKNGRVVFLGNGSDFTQPPPNELKGVGYF